MPPPVPDWSKLRHADGSAEDLPALLSTLTPDLHHPGWRTLWDRIYHQGTTYSASPYVLPYLLDIAAGASATGRLQPLFMASSIVASPEFRRNGFAETIAHLHGLAEESAVDPEMDSTDRIYMLSAMLTLGGDLIWGPALIGLADGEFCGICPQCAANVALPADPSDGAELAAPTDLNGVGARLHSLAIQVNDQGIALGIRRLFGRCVCPECREKIRVAEAVELWQRDAR